jgi:hypothetical protein
MGRDDPFLVRHTSIPAVGESNGERAVLNRMGFQVVVDFFTQLTLSGLTYHMQIGTEDAPVASTTSIDDQLSWMVADNIAGYAMIPLLYEVNIGNHTTATLENSMMELDKDKVRYTSGGTAYVPANLRGDDPNAASGSFFVGTDVTVAAKSAVPNTVEFARRTLTEDVITTSTGIENITREIYSAKTRPIAVLIDASSVVLHHGVATADVNSYGVFQFAQYAKGLAV